MDWKQQAWLWFTRAGQFWLAQTVLVYLAACVVAEKPVGPKGYVAFTYHCIQWVPRQPEATRLPPKKAVTPVAPSRSSDEPHMNFMENR